MNGSVVWPVMFAVATTIECFGQARPFWIVVGILTTILTGLRAAMS